MQTFASVGFQKSLTGCLIMPRFEGITLFHSRKDVNQSFCLARGFDDFRNSVIFAKSFDFANKLDFYAIIPSYPFSIISDFLSPEAPLIPLFFAISRRSLSLSVSYFSLKCYSVSALLTRYNNYSKMF